MSEWMLFRCACVLTVEEILVSSTIRSLFWTLGVWGGRLICVLQIVWVPNHALVVLRSSMYSSLIWQN